MLELSQNWQFVNPEEKYFLKYLLKVRSSNLPLETMAIVATSHQSDVTGPEARTAGRSPVCRQDLCRTLWSKGGGGCAHPPPSQ